MPYPLNLNSLFNMKRKQINMASYHNVDPVLLLEKINRGRNS